MEPRTILVSIIIAVVLSSDCSACGLRRVLEIDSDGNKRIVEKPVIINGEYARAACAGPKIAYVDPLTGEKIIVNEIVYDADKRTSNLHNHD